MWPQLMYSFSLPHKSDVCQVKRSGFLVKERQIPYDLSYVESNKQNKLTRKIETGMDPWNRLTAVGEERCWGAG